MSICGKFTKWYNNDPIRIILVIVIKYVAVVRAQWVILASKFHEILVGFWQDPYSGLLQSSWNAYVVTWILDDYQLCVKVHVIILQSSLFVDSTTLVNKIGFQKGRKGFWGSGYFESDWKLQNQTDKSKWINMNNVISLHPDDRRNPHTTSQKIKPYEQKGREASPSLGTVDASEIRRSPVDK